MSKSVRGIAMALYNHVTICNERLGKFPLNGIASDLHETDLFLQSDDEIEKRNYENDDYNDECTNIDTRQRACWL